MLLIRKPIKRRVDLIVIPDRVWNDFCEGHVRREVRKRVYRNETTVVVSHANHWEGIPEESHVADFLTLAIQRNRIEERGKLIIRMPHRLFESLRVRIVDEAGAFTTSELEGNFVLRIQRFQSVRDLAQFDVTAAQREEIRLAMRKVMETHGLAFVVAHLHVELL